MPRKLIAGISASILLAAQALAQGPEQLLWTTALPFACGRRTRFRPLMRTWMIASTSK